MGKILGIVVAILFAIGGWVLAFLLWRSTRGRNLQRLERRVKELEKHLDKAERRVMELTNLLDHKHTALVQLDADYKDLLDKVLRTERANDTLRDIVEKQNAMMAELTVRLGEAEKHIIKLLAAAGKDIDLNNLTGN